MKKILPIGLIIILAIAVGFFFLLKPANVDTENCPDPTCAAPTGTTTVATTTQIDGAITASTSASTTKTFSDAKQKVSFDYIDNFYIDNKLTGYIHPVEWPPQITVTTGKLICTSSGNEIDQNGKTESVKINGTSYCETVESEGAAGSTYTTYTYKKAFDTKVVSLTFIVRVPECLNFDEPNITNCKNEIKNFSVDNLIDGIFQSVKFQ